MESNSKYCVWQLERVGHRERQAFTLMRGVNTLGRSVNNNLQCLSIMSSRNHCCIIVNTDGSIFIKDLGSLNGTFLGKEQLMARREVSLRKNDFIGIGVDVTDNTRADNCIFELTCKDLSEDDLRQYDEKCLVSLRECNNIPVNSTFVAPASSSRTRSSIQLTSPSVSLAFNASTPSTSTGITNNNTLARIPLPKPAVKIETITVTDSDSDNEEVKDPTIKEVVTAKEIKNEVEGVVTKERISDSSSEDIITTKVINVEVITYKKVEKNENNDVGKKPSIESIVPANKTNIPESTLIVIESDDEDGHKNSTLDDKSSKNVVSDNECAKNMSVDSDEVKVCLKSKQITESSLLQMLEESTLAALNHDVIETEIEPELEKHQEKSNVQLNLGEKEEIEIGSNVSAQVATDDECANKELVESVEDPVENSSKNLSSHKISLKPSDIVSASMLEMTSVVQCSKTGEMNEKRDDLEFSGDKEEAIVIGSSYNKNIVDDETINANATDIEGTNIDCDSSFSKNKSPLLINDILVDSISKESNLTDTLDRVAKISLTNKETYNVDNTLGTSTSINSNKEDILDVEKSQINENMSDVGQIIQNIYKRRLSAKSETTKNINTCEDNITIDKKDKKEDQLSSSTENVSVNIGDDVILIDDDDDADENLPCSQMFDMKSEEPEVENRPPAEYHVDLDEDDISETDSADEWFQRLSQCGGEIGEEDDEDCLYGSQENISRVLLDDVESIQSSTNELEVHEEIDEARHENFNIEDQTRRDSENEENEFERIIEPTKPNKNFVDHDFSKNKINDLEITKNELSEDSLKQNYFRNKRKLSDSLDVNEDSVINKKITKESCNLEEANNHVSETIVRKSSLGRRKRLQISSDEDEDIPPVNKRKLHELSDEEETRTNVDTLPNHYSDKSCPKQGKGQDSLTKKKKSGHKTDRQTRHDKSFIDKSVRNDQQSKSEITLDPNCSSALKPDIDVNEAQKQKQAKSKSKTRKSVNTVKEVEKRKSSVDSDGSTTSFSSGTSHKLRSIDIFGNEIINKDSNTICESNNMSSAKLKSSKNKSNKRKKREKELRVKVSSESDSTNSFDLEASNKIEHRKEELYTIHEEKIANKDSSETSDDNSTPQWVNFMNKMLVTVDQKSQGQSKTCGLIQSSVDENKSITSFEKIRCQDVSDKMPEGVMDIETEIIPSLIAKSKHTEKSLGSKKPSIMSTNYLKVKLDEKKCNLKICDDKEKKINQGKDTKIMVSSETKLVVVSKKITAAHKKKPIQIIEAKSLSVNRRKSATTGTEGLCNKEDLRSEILCGQWLSKDASGSKQANPPISKSDMKAYRKAKLKDIAKKSAESNITEEKPKSANKAKNTIKNTSKSRNEIFLDTLVSKDNVIKDSTTLVEKNDKENKKNKSELKESFKIPRKAIVEKIIKPNTSNAIVKQTIDESNKTNICIKATNNSSKPQTQIDKNPTTENLPEHATKPTGDVDNFSLVDQILTNKVSNCVTNKLKARVSHALSSGVENEEPIDVKRIPDNEEPHSPSLNIPPLKSIVKPARQVNSVRVGSKKKVKFHRPGDNSNVVYVYVRDFEVDDNENTMKMVKPRGKIVAKAERPPPRKNIIAPFTSYFEETIHQIISWNTVWFDEKNSVKGEPTVFRGQVFPLHDYFSGYNDYRRSMFPLLLYELWQSVSKHYDLVHKKNNPFHIEIRNVTTVSVNNQSLNLQDTQRKYCRLECQMLLDREMQGLWPRAGDLVIAGLKLIDQTTKKWKCRIMGHLYTSNVRNISTHKAVSPGLRHLCPRASSVMDFTLHTQLQKLPLDVSEASQICVVKNIRPDLRLFDALDRLPSSPLLNIICHPKENNVNLNHLDLKTAYPPIAHLNPSQKKAAITVARACSSNEVMIHLIHGPPGCGKSEVIIGIILQMWFTWYHKQSSGRPRILLCAPSNAAVDDIFIRLMDIRQNLTKMNKFNMVRIGRTDMTHKNVSSMTLDFLVDKELKKARDLYEDEQLKRVELNHLQAKKNQFSYQLDNLGKKKGDFQYTKNLEKKLAETIEKIRELETGKSKKLDAHELRERKKDIEFTLLENAEIIATTLSSCYNTQMEQAYLNGKLRFTCCIVDEATQCTEPETLIPLMLGVSSLVLVGDPQQLPATVLSSKAKQSGLDRSLFARQQDWWLRQAREAPFPSLSDSPCHFLSTQYRMHPAIAQWPAEFFYKKKLLTHDSLERRSATCPLLPYVVLSHEFPQSRQEESNQEEVRMVIHLVHSIAKLAGCDQFSIGVITPYNRQKDLIRKKLDLDLNVEVGTVDSFQGRERDIIIFSCVRTDGVGFMAGAERLNVALTRARHSLIICGNFRSLQANETWASLLNNAKSRGVFRPVRHICEQTLLQEVVKPNLPSTSERDQRLN